MKRDLSGELARLRNEFAAGKRRSAADDAARRLLAGAPELESEAALEGGGEIEVGGRVRHAGLGWTGVLERLDGDRASVRVGGKRLTAGADELVALGDAPKRRAATASTATLASDDAPPELQLIGMRVEEALEVLDGWLDRALAGAAREVRVVHGHGTGRLRTAVRAHLQRHPAVASHRSGAPNEGGNGATVVTLKG
ncbi:MAG: Smr/MutS family protein [Acidobacteria bacterium]|nr:Smr/MutS family protein [Acidobacteriota bacterium]